MSDQHPLRRYWRVAALVVLVTLSLALVFGVVSFGAVDGPALLNQQDANTTESEYTTLSFGLELAGGTRIQAPLHGHYASGVELNETVDSSDLEQEIGAALDTATPTDVTVYTRADDPESRPAIEVTSRNTSANEFRAALDAQGIEYEGIHDGVTDETRAETIRVLEDKINEAGLSGGTVREVQGTSGEYVLIEVPEERREDVRKVIQERGAVQIDIYYPTGEETDTGERKYKTRTAVLEQGDFKNVGPGKDTRQYGPHVPVVLRDSAADEFETATMETGLATDGGSQCWYEERPNTTEACLVTRVDGKVVYSAGMSPNLAGSIENGEWVKDPQFVLQTNSYTEAQDLSLHLRAGALPAALNTDAGTTTYVSPTQGERFKIAGLMIGLLASLAVALKVYYRYRDIRVAGPMIATALSEVVILLGLAAVIGYPIDLAVIGGFIAVIGTGVDDLIIVANEVLKQGEVTSEKVFQSRFRKAFWVIGAAALTTIVALSPLMYLSLGKLRGFAIFTILGVLVGVLITRPAYGDVLNYLLIDERHDD